MVARLGDVLYWALSGLSGLIVIFGAFANLKSHPPDWETFLIAVAGAFLVWLFGRACRYVLAGR